MVLNQANIQNSLKLFTRLKQQNDTIRTALFHKNQLFSLKAIQKKSGSQEDQVTISAYVLLCVSNRANLTLTFERKKSGQRPILISRRKQLGVEQYLGVCSGESGKYQL